MEGKFSKETSGYGIDKNDFVIENELTVTITLNEYRELISVKAKRDEEKEKLQSKCWKLESEISKLKDKILELTTSESEADENVE